MEFFGRNEVYFFHPICGKEMLKSIIEQALQRNSHVDSKWFQFATVDLNGAPTVRTLVFRGFEGDNTIAIATDIRSEKIDHLKNNPNAEICWYFKDSREQLRIRVRCEIVQGDRAIPYWKNLSPFTRAQFTWPMEPQEGHFPAELHLSDPIAAEAFSNFCVLFCHATQIKILDLFQHPGVPRTIKL
jgi:PPOX class probable FMN-dependent enzyme